MIVLLDLPDELASRLSQLPEGLQDSSAIAAISDALNFRDSETDDCISIVGQVLADMDEGKNLFSFKDYIEEIE